MSDRKLKPGPKRSAGRPRITDRRAKDRARLAEENNRLRDAGYRRVTVTLPEAEAAVLVEHSPVHRLSGLLKAAEDRCEVDLANQIEARLQVARTEQKLKSRNRAAAQLKKQKADREAQRLEERQNAHRLQQELSPFFKSRN